MSVLWSPPSSGMPAYRPTIGSPFGGSPLGGGGGTGDGYRGGATGVTNDYGLRDIFANAAVGAYNNDANNRFAADMNFANTRNSALGQAGGMVTNAQVSGAQGELRPIEARYQNLADHGKYSQQEYNNVLTDRYNQAAMAKEGMQKQLNSSLTSMGLGLNPGATAALGSSGEFAAAGQRGEALAGLTREQADSRMQGLQGMGQIAQQLAAIGVMPTQENMMAMIDQMKAPNVQSGSAGGIMDLYNQYRNAAIGPGSGLGAPAPTAPNYYGLPGPRPGGMVTY